MKPVGKNYNFCSNMHYDVHYYPAKFKNKIQLVHGEKNNKFYYGVK